MRNTFLILSIFLIIISSCNKSAPKKEENPKFVRTWFDTVQGMPLKQKLIIKENKTFEFSSRACQDGSKSNGTWKIEKDTIILNSVKPKGCLFQHKFGFCIIIGNNSYLENNKTIEGCEPSGRDSSYEIFENEKFFMRNDTLIHKTKKNAPCPNLKIAYSMKEKNRKLYNK